jgi:hypothetical protein
MIEQKIQELIDALNANTAALTGTAPKSKKAKSETTAEKIVTPPAVEQTIIALNQPSIMMVPAHGDICTSATIPTPVTPPAPVVEISQTAMREVCQQILDKGAKDKLREINTKHGLARATESIGTDKAAVVFADLKALAASL